MPALVAGIHVFNVSQLKRGVDGRDKPGHDAKNILTAPGCRGRWCASPAVPRARVPLGQRIAAADLDFHDAGLDRREQRAGAPQQLAALLGMGREGGARDIERTEPVELEHIERRNRPRCGAERDQHAARRQTAQRFRERVLADGIAHHRHAAALGQRYDGVDEILLGVDDGGIASMRTGDRGLLLGPDRADHVGAEVLGPLAEQDPDAAGRGMDQNMIAGSHRERGVNQIMRGDALGEDRRRERVRNCRRQRHQPIRRHQAQVGIGADRHRGIDHAIAGLAGTDRAAHRLDGAGRLHADRRGIGGKRIAAGAMLDIDIIQPDRGLPDEDFVRLRRWDIVRLVAQDRRRSRFHHDDAMGAHAKAPCSRTIDAIGVAGAPQRGLD